MMMIQLGSLITWTARKFTMLTAVLFVLVSFIKCEISELSEILYLICKYLRIFYNDKNLIYFCGCEDFLVR